MLKGKREERSWGSTSLESSHYSCVAIAIALQAIRVISLSLLSLHL